MRDGKTLETAGWEWKAAREGSVWAKDFASPHTEIKASFGEHR